jgi:hypothetical protein
MLIPLNLALELHRRRRVVHRREERLLVGITRMNVGLSGPLGRVEVDPAPGTLRIQDADAAALREIGPAVVLRESAFEDKLMATGEVLVEPGGA